MPEALDVDCPSCGTHLKVDAESGAVVWVDKKKEPAKDFDELVMAELERRGGEEEHPVEDARERALQHVRIVLRFGRREEAREACPPVLEMVSLIEDEER